MSFNALFRVLNNLNLILLFRNIASIWILRLISISFSQSYCHFLSAFVKQGTSIVLDFFVLASNRYFRL